MNQHMERLEWPIITQALAQHATCDNARARCLSLMPLDTLLKARQAQKETTDARLVLEAMGTPPLATMAELNKSLSLIGMDAMLSPEQITAVTTFLTTCRRMKSYLQKAEVTGADIAYYGRSLVALDAVEEETDRCIRNGAVDDRASDKLYSLRREIASSGEKIKAKLNTLLQRNPKWFSEAFISIRNGRYTLPVKRELKQSVPGQLVDMSSSGATCFIEPQAVGKITDELSQLHIEEDAEVRRILYTLTALIESHLPEIKLNIEAMETLDFLFAKAKYAIALDASPAQIDDSALITLIKARHPLLDKQSAVPLDFEIGGDIRGVIITGPNTGGKTVALKTLGLLSLMAQSGLHVPADALSAFSMRDQILCDIGDGQSITQNLSTFSSHIVNVTQILKELTPRSLVLLDELGSGTDPQEGMGIAKAILEELSKRGCLFLATTHYPEIKAYAASKDMMRNARMAFDRQTLSPLFRLELGAAGESCALYIAQKLGFPEHLIAIARQAAYAAPTPIAQESIRQVMPREIANDDSIKDVPRSQRFQLGDSVMVYPQKEIGIVCTRADHKGMIGVMLKNKKQYIIHKRLKLHIAATELYPDDYDFSIVFDSVATRKAHHKMTKRHDPNIIIREDD